MTALNYKRADYKAAIVALVSQYSVSTCAYGADLLSGKATVGRSFYFCAAHQVAHAVAFSLVKFAFVRLPTSLKTRVQSRADAMNRLAYDLDTQLSMARQVNKDARHNLEAVRVRLDALERVLMRRSRRLSGLPVENQSAE